MKLLPTRLSFENLFEFLTYYLETSLDKYT